MVKAVDSTHTDITKLLAAAPSGQDSFASTAPKVVASNLAHLLTHARQLNVLAALAIPHIMEFLFPPLFIYFWEQCTSKVDGERGFPKLGLGIPRGHGKTIFLKLLILYIILFTRRKFILVICARADLAAAIVSDVIDTLSHDNIRTIFGNWDEQVEIDRQDAKRFTFRGRTIILKGVGQGTSFRGIAEKFARPDVMLFDDAQTRDCAMSEQQAKEYAAWFRGTAMKAKDPKFCFYLYVGNMYSKLEIEAPTPTRNGIYGCMLKNLKLSPHWETIIVGAILTNGTALWEELQPLAQLLQEYQEDSEAGHEDVFLAEVMNDDEAINTNIFDDSKVPPFPFTWEVQEQASCLIIDPSLGRKSSDEQQVGHMKVVDGQTILYDVRNFQCSAPQLVRQCIDWCLESNIPAIVIEDYAYQASLGQWLEDIMNPSGITSINGIHGIEGIQILLINRGRASKNSAIRSTLKEIEEGMLWLHPRVVAKVYSEIRAWNPIKTDNRDNILDVATYCNYVKNKYPTEILTPLTIALSSTHALNPPVLDCGLQHG